MWRGGVMLFVDQATQCIHFTLQCLHVLSFIVFSNLYIYIQHIFISYILQNAVSAKKRAFSHGILSLHAQVGCKGMS